MRYKRIALLVALLIVLASGFAAMSWIRRGFSARDEPSSLEAFVARRVRSLAIPAAERAALNPVPLTAEVLAEARAHFADHCATCHGNDGSGTTEIGRNLYPRAPDMRLPATQSLTDGELFYIIHNGIRLTGMPAWGGADEARDVDSWKLVHFIRRVSSLTPGELNEMERLNPKTPEELEEEKEDQQFLNESAAELGETGHHGATLPAPKRR